MNRKLFVNLIFIIAGSFIVGTIGVIVTLNFIKDSRILSTPVAQADGDSQNGIFSELDGANTFKYKRAPNAEVEKKDYGEDIPPVKQANKDGNKDGVKDGIKVELINNSGNEELSEDVKNTLEAAGFDVTVVGAKGKRANTVIIERNDKKAGSTVLEVLKVGTILRWPDAKSKYDVTIKIGQDFMP